jgi:hypothetical protein
MKKNITRFFKLALGALSLGAPLGAQATFTPVAVTGFNQDVIADGTGVLAPAASTYDVDGSGGAGYCFMVNGYTNGLGGTATQGLPATGLIRSASVSGLTFQLGSYSGNNSLRIPATGNTALGSGTLTFATPTIATDIYLLNTGGGGPGTVTVTVNFNDATSQVFTGQSIPDWYTTVTSDAMGGLGRVARTASSSVDNNTTAPRLHQLKVTLTGANVNKLISSITIAKTGPTTGSSAINIFGVSVDSPCAGTPTAGTTVASVGSACSNTSIGLSLNGGDAGMGISYQWQSFISGGAGWANITGATAYTYNVPGQADATQYRAKVTCANSALFAYSTPVTVAQNPFYSCYCAPTSTGTNEYIRSVNVNNTSGFTNASNANSTNGYGDFTTDATLTTTLNKGGSYPLTVIVQANNNGSQGGLWIDYDHNSVFDASEYSPFGASNLTGQAVTFSTVLTIPNTGSVRTGLTRMRLRWRNNAVTGADACATGWAGETEDYLVTIAPSTDCTGTPPRVTATASQTTVCRNTAISLSATGIPVGVSGFTYQWQSAPTGTTTFTNLGLVQTSPNYTVADQAVGSDYQLIVTCTASGRSNTSRTVTVNQNDFTTCYCTPTHSSGCGTYGSLLRVAITGTSLSNTTACAGSPYYTNVAPGATTTATLNIGGTYQTSMLLGRYTKAGFWIDYDHSGSFEASEYTAIGTNSSSVVAGVTYTPSITIPATALTGATKMRVRGQYYFTSTSYPLDGTNACTGFTYGETEDYTITLVTPTPCAGTPAATTATASAASVCSTASFSLSLTGLDPALTGLSYQWQSSPAGAGTFANLGAAQTTPFYTVSGLTADTDYRAIVTCVNGGASSTSSTVTVAYGYLSCYCSPASTPTNEYITNVTLPGVNGFSNSTTNPAGYNDYTANASLTTTLYRGVPYVNGVSASFRSNDTGSQGGMWIDYDHSGTFDASEYLLLGSSDSIATIVRRRQNLTVPTTALLGPTRVRVRWRNDPFTGADACVAGTSIWYGETEDYLITIADAPTCTAPPLTVTVASSVASACTNGSFSLSTNSVSTTLGGYTFQWQSRPAGSGAFFNDINGATTNPYTVVGQAAATEYQLIVTCQYGGSPTTSAPVTVGQNSFDQCYCTTSSTNGCSQYGSITNVSIGTLNNASTCAASTYTVYPATGTATTSLDMGRSSTLTLSVAQAGTYSYRYAVWIDYNHNGTFETTEFVASGAPSNAATATASLAIPLESATVLSGPTRMRVRTNAGILSYGNFSAGDACVVTYNGETEDYTINLVAPTPCAGTPPTPAATATVTSACVNSSFTLAATIPGNITGLTYQWESRPAGTGTYGAISGATGTTYTVASQAAATDYRVVLTCTSGGASATSNVLSVGQNSFMACYCQPTSSSVGEYFTNVTLGSINNTTGSSVPNAVTGYADYTASPTATQTTALTRGLPYTIAVTAVDNRINSQALLWIDYNHSGTFDASEYTLVGSGPTSGTFPQTLTFTKAFTVPATALMGPTHLRVRWHNDNNSTDPCGLGWNGETEEYVVNIIDSDLIVSTTAPIPAGAYNSITITGTGNGTLAGATSVVTAVVVQAGGTFTDGCQVLSGPGSFTAAPGSTLSICNVAGISASGSTGAVQVTGTRTFDSNATYVYNGSAAQVTGSGLPATVRTLTVSNAANVTLSQDVAVSRMLTLASGNFNLSSSNLLLTSTDSLTALVVNSGSGRVQNTGTGRATMQRAASPSTTYTGPGYRHYSSPMASAPVGDLGTAGYVPRVNAAYNALPTPNLSLAQFPNVFDYQESRLTATYSGFEIGWHSPTATTDVLAPTKGYTVNIAPITVDLTGLLNTGTLNSGALTHGSGPDAGWQFLGNPYPAPLDWSLVTAAPANLPTGLDASVYIFEPNSQYGGFYRAYTNGAGTNGFTGVLPAMQGFFVRTTQAVAAGFNFRDAYRVTSYQNPRFYRSAADPRPMLRLSLSSSAVTGTDEAIVYLEAGATTTGTDARFDAAKMANPGAALSLATQLPGSPALAINGLPLAATSIETRLPLVLAVPAAGTYRFDVAALRNFDSSAAVLLLDHALNTRTDLRQVSTYAFTAAQRGAVTGRFELLLGRPGTVTATTAALASQFSVWPNPATEKAALHVALSTPAPAATLTLRTVLGQVVKTQTFGGSETTIATTGLAAGTYLLTVQATGQAATTRRVVVE